MSKQEYLDWAEQWLYEGLLEINSHMKSEEARQLAQSWVPTYVALIERLKEYTNGRD